MTTKKNRKYVARLAVLATGLLFIVALPSVAPAPPPQGLHFEMTYSASVNKGPVTGRMFITMSPTKDPEPRIAAYNSARARTGKNPFFAIDVEQLRPGQVAVIDAGAVGFPYWTLKELPPGDYWIQGILIVYTQFLRADGHVIWAHMDQREGQRWAFAPGNL